MTQNNAWIFFLVLAPALAGLVSFAISSDRWRRGLWLVTAATHVGWVVALWYFVLPEEAPTYSHWIGLDSLGLWFISITSALFFVASLYGIGYLSKEEKQVRKDFEEEVFFKNEPEQIFTGCLLLFLASMSLVTVSQHWGLFWIAIEATTLTSAPLIYFHRHHRSLEAMWKYLLICSVGIALALLGTFFLAGAVSTLSNGMPSLTFTEVQRLAKQCPPSLLKIAFLFLLVGYGTKMGLVPFHTWLPDAHSEAPSVVSALLSGALLNCAFLGIFRAYQVLWKAGLGGFGQGLFIFFGLLSMAVATLFMIGQRDYKRMIAYSSIEHMGILALALGVGGRTALFGAFLHTLNHSLAKAMLFFTAGNLLSVYRTKSIRDVQGVLHFIPLSGSLWLLGFFIITGTPPFGLFISEIIIFKGILEGGHVVVAILYLFLLAVAFIAMASLVLHMVQGSDPAKEDFESGLPGRKESLLSVGPPLLLALALLFLGVYLPVPLQNYLNHLAYVLQSGG